MRYGIFSDIHSDLEALDAVIEAYGKEKIDKYLCVGDVVGYAANPKECIEKIKELVEVSIAGNHDWASVDLFPLDYFNPVALEAILWTKKKLGEVERYFLASLQLVFQNEDLTLVHGTLDNPQDFHYLLDMDTAYSTFELLKTKVCFVGHSHVPGVFIRDSSRIFYTQDSSVKIKDESIYIVNVGSVGQPRDKDPRAAYCIYDTKEKLVQIKRIDYDIKTAREKIIQAGLPEFLGDRLLVGR